MLRSRDKHMPDRRCLLSERHAERGVERFSGKPEPVHGGRYSRERRAPGISQCVCNLQGVEWLAVPKLIAPERMKKFLRCRRERHIAFLPPCRSWEKLATAGRIRSARAAVPFWNPRP